MGLLDKKFSEIKSFAGYEQVIKANLSNWEASLREIDTTKKSLIQLENTKGLSQSQLDLMPDRTDVRIVGGYTQDYMDGLKSPDGTPCRQKATYSKSEIKEVILGIEEIEKGINASWNDKEKMLYFFQTLKKRLPYRKLKNDYIEDRGRQYDTLLPFAKTQPHEQVCVGYALMFKELCDRNGLRCKMVGGERNFYGKNHGHAWNIANVGGKNILIDIQQAAEKYHYIDRQGSLHTEDRIDDLSDFGVSPDKFTLYKPKNGERDYTVLSSLSDTERIHAYQVINGNIQKISQDEIIAIKNERKLEKSTIYTQQPLHQSVASHSIDEPERTM